MSALLLHSMLLLGFLQYSSRQDRLGSALFESAQRDLEEEIGRIFRSDAFNHAKRNQVPARTQDQSPTGR